MEEKDKYREAAMRYCKAEAEQRSLAEGLMTADRRKDEQYKKNKAQFRPPVPADRDQGRYSQTLLSFERVKSPRLSPPRRQRLGEDEKEQYRNERRDELTQFASQIAGALEQRNVTNRQSTQAMIDAFTATQQTLIKNILLVVLEDKICPGIIRHRI